MIISNLRQGSMIVRIGAVAMGAAAMATLAVGTASAATSEPAAGQPVTVQLGQSQPDVTLHPADVVAIHGEDFTLISDNGVSWTADVTIDKGRTGSYTKCSDGTVIYGPAIKPGNWQFGGTCDEHGTLAGFGTYDVKK
jgi:hypothetical protein